MPILTVMQDENRVWLLVARKLSRESTLEELRELEQLLLADPELAYRIDLYTQYYEHTSAYQRSATDVQQSWQITISKLGQQFPTDFSPPEYRRRNFSRTKILVVAACVFCVLAVMAWYFMPEKSSPLAVADPVLHEMNTLPGTRTQLTLPDGTVVWMNSDSHLSYNSSFGKKIREVTLSGEAFFDVAHNAAVPMVVHAQSVNIWVKGTAFNVRGYPEAGKVETSLIRGSIELTTNADLTRKILLRPNEKITIETAPGLTTKNLSSIKPAIVKQPYFHIDILKTSALSNTIPEVSWMNDKLVFDNEPFSDVAKKMEKRYDVQIVIENQELAAKQVSGVFDKEDISQALSALRMTISFDFRMKGKTIYIK